MSERGAVMSGSLFWIGSVYPENDFGTPSLPVGVLGPTLVLSTSALLSFRTGGFLNLCIGDVQKHTYMCSLHPWDTTGTLQGVVIKKGVGIASRAQGSKVTPAEDTGKLCSTSPSEFCVLSTLLDVLFRKRGRPWALSKF